MQLFCLQNNHIHVLNKVAVIIATLTSNEVNHRALRSNHVVLCTSLQIMRKHPEKRRIHILSLVWQH
jgi:hypothetical protein